MLKEKDLASKDNQEYGIDEIISWIHWMRWNRYLMTSVPCKPSRYPLMKEIKEIYLKCYLWKIGSV